MLTKTLIGIVTFGGLDFTKLAVRSLQETITHKDVEVFIVVGKPGDIETAEWCKESMIPHIIHEENHGFPASVNDIYKYGWVDNDYDNIIIMGNDVIAYPYAIDRMIDLAEASSYELICANEFDVRALCIEFPEARPYFSGDALLFTDFSARPWELFQDYKASKALAPAAIANVQNLCLYKRSVFDKIGYTDANFYPAYFIDNDYARRAVNADLKCCTMPDAVYFHFWSRTIKQGTGGASNHKFFTANREFYRMKWNGDFGKEGFTIPFDGVDFNLTESIKLPGALKISDNSLDREIAAYWRNK
jgi:GT2 family glycosyltransferase